MVEIAFIKVVRRAGVVTYESPVVVEYHEGGISIRVCQIVKNLGADGPVANFKVVPDCTAVNSGADTVSVRVGLDALSHKIDIDHLVIGLRHRLACRQA